jgi:hypothetical protein
MTTRLKKPSTPVRRKRNAASSVTSPRTATKHPCRALRPSEITCEPRAVVGMVDGRQDTTAPSGPPPIPRWTAWVGGRLSRVPFKRLQGVRMQTGLVISPSRPPG